MALEKTRLDKVCKPGYGAGTCSFLGMGADGFECLKGASIENAIRNQRKAGTMNSMGDNCSGPPEFTPTNTEP